MHTSITELLEPVISSASASGESKMSFLNRSRTFPVSAGCGFVAQKLGTFLPHEWQRERMGSSSVSKRQNLNEFPKS